MSKLSCPLRAPRRMKIRLSTLTLPLSPMKQYRNSFFVTLNHALNLFHGSLQGLMAY